MNNQAATINAADKSTEPSLPENQVETEPIVSQFPPPPQHPPRKKSSLPFILIVVAIIILVGFNLWLFFLGQNQEDEDGKLSFFPSRVKPTPTPTSTPTPTPKPTPTPYPIPYEKQIYRLSHGPEVKGPKMTEVTVDPFDPKIGEKQTITVKINHTNPVVSATVTLQTDNGTKKTYPLSRITGTDTNGTWQGSWTTENPHNYVYNAAFELKSAIDSYTGTLTFRYDPIY